MERVRKHWEKIQEEKERLQSEVKEKTAGYIMAAFGLVAGLAWNQAIQALIAKFFPNPGNDLIPKFVYAIVVTLVVVIISVYLVRLTQKKDQSK